MPDASADGLVELCLPRGRVALAAELVPRWRLYSPNELTWPPPDTTLIAP